MQDKDLKKAFANQNGLSVPNKNSADKAPDTANAVDDSKTPKTQPASQTTAEQKKGKGGENNKVIDNTPSSGNKPKYRSKSLTEVWPEGYAPEGAAKPSVSDIPPRADNDASVEGSLSESPKTPSEEAENTEAAEPETDAPKAEKEETGASEEKADTGPSESPSNAVYELGEAISYKDIAPSETPSEEPENEPEKAWEKAPDLTLVTTVIEGEEGHEKEQEKEIEPEEEKGMHPGYYIQKAIDEKGITPEELSELLGTPLSHVSLLLSYKQRVSNKMAGKLSSALGNSFDYWIGLQKEYDEKMAEAVFGTKSESKDEPSAEKPEEEKNEEKAEEKEEPKPKEKEPEPEKEEISEEPAEEKPEETIPAESEAETSEKPVPELVSAETKKVEAEEPAEKADNSAEKEEEKPAEEPEAEPSDAGITLDAILAAVDTKTEDIAPEVKDSAVTETEANETKDADVADEAIPCTDTNEADIAPEAEEPAQTETEGEDTAEADISQSSSEPAEQDEADLDDYESLDDAQAEGSMEILLELAALSKQNLAAEAKGGSTDDSDSEAAEVADAMAHIEDVHADQTAAVHQTTKQNTKPSAAKQEPAKQATETGAKIQAENQRLKKKVGAEKTIINILIILICIALLVLLAQTFGFIDLATVIFP